MSAASAAIYAEPGYLLFAREERLVAQRFDVKRLQPAGEMVVLGETTISSWLEGAALVSASTNGVLIHAATGSPDTQLVWLDRGGRPLGTVPIPPAGYATPVLSPDDRQVIVTRISSPTSRDLWQVDLQRALATRLTFDGLVAPGGTGGGSPVVWSPDGSRAAYMYTAPGRYDVYEVFSSGAARPEPLLQSGALFKYPAAWSPDGKYLVYCQYEGGQYDLWLMPLQGDRKLVPYLHTAFNEEAAAISPDGHWLAYTSDETGTTETYVRSFPETGERYHVSTSGGGGVQWSRDGKEILIRASGLRWGASYGPIYAVDVQTGRTFKAGTPRLLFTPRQDILGFAATSDLQRFLAAVPVAGAPPPSITVVLNWPAGLAR